VSQATLCIPPPSKPKQLSKQLPQEEATNRNAGPAADCAQDLPERAATQGKSKDANLAVVDRSVDHQILEAGASSQDLARSSCFHGHSSIMDALPATGDRGSAPTDPGGRKVSDGSAQDETATSHQAANKLDKRAKLTPTVYKIFDDRALEHGKETLSAMTPGLFVPQSAGSAAAALLLQHKRHRIPGGIE
jgi:hypothetical protein